MAVARLARLGEVLPFSFAPPAPCRRCERTGRLAEAPVVARYFRMPSWSISDL